MPQQKHDPLTNTNDVELETSFKKLALNLCSDTVETDMAFGHHGTLLGGHCGRHDSPRLTTVILGADGLMGKRLRVSLLSCCLKDGSGGK